MKFFTFLLALCTTFSLFSQKKIIDHTIYNDWKRLGDAQISNDGKFTTYTIKPHRGDGFLYLVNNETFKTDSFPRSVNPNFTNDSKVLVFKINPSFDTLRKCELEKVKKDKQPKDSLAIYYLSNDSLVKIANIKDYQLSPELATIAFLSNENKLQIDKVQKKEKKKRNRKKKKSKEPTEIKSDGSILTLIDTQRKAKTQIKNVTEFKFSENGEKIAYITHRKVKQDTFHLNVMDLMKDSMTFMKPFSSIANYNFDKKGEQLAFVSSQDTVKFGKIYNLNYVAKNDKEHQVLVDTLDLNLPILKSVSEHFKPYFSLDGSKIYFGVGTKPEKEVKDTLLDNEKAKVDVWHWKDDRLQPQQLLELKRDEKNSFLSVYNLQNKSFQILENDSLQIRHDKNNPSPFALVTNENPYEDKYNWEYPNKRDVYRINLETNKTDLIRKSAIYQVDLSPSGNYAIYFNEKDQEQYLIDLSTKKENCITCSTKAVWLDDVNGMPITPNPYGIYGWEKGEKAIFIQSKYQIYKYDIEKAKLKGIITTEENRKIRYNLRQWSYDSLYLDFENTYLTSFDEKDKSESIYTPKWHDSHLDLIEIVHSNHTFSGIKKTKNSNDFVFQKASLADYPDLYKGNLSKPELSTKISITNPQQNDYNWAEVELVSWKSYSGLDLEGLLYKPENYDPSKKYPLLVYFYEMYSDELHNHYAPRPTASIVYPTEYASAGYFVLIPDIRYKPGYPAKGAYDCIMSGTDYVLKKYPTVDSTRMGLQGQSWGGYQTAQLITMTKRYKAAMAGAPVSNMFSAYGGIRWGSGLNRQFQYERTQSRIGKTIWEAPELYTENSPLFHLPKVETPLLIMHNDADGAVPWYQGIELFTGLKRLQKPVWMLNYNGDDHNLMKNANRFDLSIRMRQFFDYYLLDAPAPVWLIDGVPAVKKGKDYGLDLK